MDIHLLGQLPDEISTWTGPASALADECNRLMPACGLESEAGSANERLVRHYVQIGVLTPPEREGRDALFGARQIAEFLAARRLLSEGWPLAKIGELLKNVVLVPDSAHPDLAREAAPADRTPAEKALQRIRAGGSQAGKGSKAQPRASHVADPASAPTPSTPAAASPPASWQHFSSASLASPLRLATEIAQRRGELRENLIALGNASGAPERQRMVRISLTPWCHVDVEAGHLGRLSEIDPEILGNALAHALREERLRKGNKS